MSLALRVKKICFFIAIIFDLYINFLDLLFFDLLDLDKFITVLLAFLLLFPTILLLLALNVFKAEFLYDLIVFNIEISSITILLKPLIKRQ